MAMQRDGSVLGMSCRSERSGFRKMAGTCSHDSRSDAYVVHLMCFGGRGHVAAGSPVISTEGSVSCLYSLRGFRALPSARAVLPQLQFSHLHT